MPCSDQSRITGVDAAAGVGCAHVCVDGNTKLRAVSQLVKVVKIADCGDSAGQLLLRLVRLPARRHAMQGVNHTGCAHRMPECPESSHHGQGGLGGRNKGVKPRAQLLSVQHNDAH